MKHSSPELGKTAGSLPSTPTATRWHWTLEQNVGVIEAEPVIPTGWEAVLDPSIQWGVVKADGEGKEYTGFVSNDLFHITGAGVTADGGQGNDLYYIENANGLKILEDSNGGSDTAITRIRDFKINPEAQVETILLDDSKLEDKVGQSATGNKYTKMITGNALDNNLTAGSTVSGVTLNGGDGDDRISLGGVASNSKVTLGWRRRGRPFLPRQCGQRRYYPDRRW